MNPVMVDLRKSGIILFKLIFLFFFLFSEQGFGFQKNPHGNIKIPCNSCHVADNWKIMKSPMTFNHTSDTKFPLTGSHQNAQCSSCHAKLNFQIGTSTCQSCHEDIHKGTLGVNCETCHQTTTWSPLPHSKIMEIHNTGRFPLTGAHQTADCFGCHVKSGNGAIFRINNSLECIACHKMNYNTAKNPDHALLGFPFKCQDCHSSFSWVPASFNHDTFSFPLTGAHKSVLCESCHAGNKFKGTAKNCNSCHQKDFVKTTNPNHIAANFSTECQTCHSTFSWKPASFDHNTTSFPLTGGHISTTCESCHKNNVFKGLNKTCFPCHQTDFNNVVNPNHVSGKFSTECQTCHITTTWKPSTFNHSQTSFPLTGSHTTATCESCHKNGVFAGTSKTCVSCHQSNFDQSKNPNHIAAGFSTDCQTCHSTFSWQPATFDHNTTAFPLTGGHIPVTCSSCHKNDVFKGLNKTCYPCHQTDFNNVVNPNHVTAKFPVTCETCHTTISWKPASFDHDTFSFPLTGAHKTVSCESCHAGNIFKGTPKDCNSCHQKDFVKTTNPNHVAANFSTECQTCHSTFSWKPASFDHNTTSFPLTGGHISVTCSSCHKNDVFKGLSKNCYSCHQTDFNNVVSPNHVTGKFSTECQTCHTTTKWNPSTFNHSQTSFPLTGTHVTATCESCHKNGVFAGTSKTCVSCHQSNFDQSKNPNHIAAGFSTDCQTCHSTFSWQPASFDHNTTAFPLTGNHISVTCNSCHKNDVFKGLSKTCYPCHQTDFQNVVSPNHVSGNFSTNCETCHTTSAWKPSTFDHNNTSFPLTGSHKTTTCESCHKNGVFKGTSKTCYPCHQTDFTKVTSPNHVSGKFPVTCETCHTTIAWKPSSFNHDAMYFPIYSGEHNGKWSSCAQCHQQPTNYKSFTCMSSGCHAQASTNSKHNGVGGYSYTASACYSCHPKGKE